MRAKVETATEIREKGQEMAETNPEKGEASVEKGIKEKIVISVETGIKEEIVITVGDHPVGSALLTEEAPDVILGMIGVKIGGAVDLTAGEEGKAEGKGHTVIKM